MQILPGTRSTGDLPTCDRVSLLGFGDRGVDQPASLNSAIDRRPHGILKTRQRAMWVVIEIQVLGKTCALGKTPNARAALQDEARGCRAAIQKRQQPQLKCIAS